MIEIPALTKTYGEHRVLSISPLSLSEGESYALVGANGSGKSTLLRILSGVIPADEGRFTEFCEGDYRLGYLPQQPYGFQSSVLHNVMLALPKEEREEARAMEALKMVGLAELADHRGSRLSGGETQRMAMARMLVRRRSLLLLDEPTSATDIAGNDLVEEALKAYRQQTGCTVLMATHSLAQAARLCSQMIFLYRGEIAAMGPTRELLDHPEEPRLKEFLAHWRI